MEILKIRLYTIQRELEEAIKLEIDYDEVKETRYGNKLLKYIRKRHKITNLCIKILDRI
jgi:hypothetical protein